MEWVPNWGWGLRVESAQTRDECQVMHMLLFTLRVRRSPFAHSPRNVCVFLKNKTKKVSFRLERGNNFKDILCGLEKKGSYKCVMFR